MSNYSNKFCALILAIAFKRPIIWIEPSAKSGSIVRMSREDAKRLLPQWDDHSRPKTVSYYLPNGKIMVPHFMECHLIGEANLKIAQLLLIIFLNPEATMLTFWQPLDHCADFSGCGLNPVCSLPPFAPQFLAAAVLRISHCRAPIGMRDDLHIPPLPRPLKNSNECRPTLTNFHATPISIVDQFQKKE
ncbi:hypothetical protein niasHT_018224 [Heterodera trifolii]|uniref:Uncharacterized protein n=1 Tax=Heterodera trifolii TaxID=157864 RepID=A0ABD2KUF9_9BILA